MLRFWRLSNVLRSPHTLLRLTPEAAVVEPIHTSFRQHMKPAQYPEGSLNFQSKDTVASLRTRQHGASRRELVGLQSPSTLLSDCCPQQTLLLVNKGAGQRKTELPRPEAVTARTRSGPALLGATPFSHRLTAPSTRSPTSPSSAHPLTHVFTNRPLIHRTLLKRLVGH